MPDFPRLIAAITRELSDHKLPFMLIGGQAVLVHGEPRLTGDIDITLGADPTALPAVRNVCERLGFELLPQDIERFVRETFVLPARDRETDIRVDFVFSTTPYEHQAIERAVRLPLDGVPVPVATAEDLIIHKLFAGRARDWDDALGVVRRTGPTLDWPYIEHWLRQFAAIPGRDALPQQAAKLRQEAAC